MMQSDQKKLTQQLFVSLILAERVSEAVDQAKSFRVYCWEMEKRVVQLSQMLNKLVLFITMDPILFSLNPIQRVIREVSNILQEALNLACKCRRRTIFCRLFGGKNFTTFHNLYHLLDVSIANMKWVLIICNPDFGSAFNEIFLSLPQFFSNDSSNPLAWSCLVTEKLIWELAAMLTSDFSSPELKICCAEALSMLDIGSVLNSTRMMNETEELMFCLAKLVEAEDGEFQYNCLMTIMEISAAAESDLDLRCKAFKTYSPGAVAIVKQLLRVIEESDDHPELQILAIKSIGSLARIFKRSENHHVLNVLVSQLGNGHRQVATEAVVALKNFACQCNYLCKAHSSTMIELKAVQPLMKLLRDGERTLQLRGLELICHLAVNADYSKAMEEARVRTAIQEWHRHGLSQHPELKVLVSKALRSLASYYKY